MPGPRPIITNIPTNGGPTLRVSDMKIRRAIPAVLAALACALSVAAQSPQTATREPLTVMSFNIRYGTANDGDNHWTLRREFLFDVMREADADLVGLQEALDAQIAALLQALAAVRRRRRRARRRPHARRVRGDPVSARPLPCLGRRHVLVLGYAGGRRLAIVGEQHHAHLHVGPLRRSRRAAPSGITTSTSTTSRSRRGSGARRCSPSASRPDAPLPSQSSSPAISTWAKRTPRSRASRRRCRMRPRRSSIPSASAIRTSRAPARSTASSSGKTGGDKIDYVLVAPGTEVLDAAIIRTSRNDRYPSDHFPVTARIVLPR